MKTVTSIIFHVTKRCVLPEYYANLWAFHQVRRFFLSVAFLFLICTAISLPVTAAPGTLYYGSLGSTVGLSTHSAHWSSSQVAGDSLQAFSNGNYIYFSAKGMKIPTMVTCSSGGVDTPGVTLDPTNSGIVQTFRGGLLALDSDQNNPGYCTIKVKNSSSLNFNSTTLINGPVASPVPTGLFLASDGTATEIYSSRTTNTYSGGTWVSSGVEFVVEAASAIPKTGMLTFGSGTATDPLAIFRAVYESGYTCINPVTINGNVQLGNGSSDAPLTFNGPVTLTGNYTVELNAVDVTFNGAISGTGNLNLGSISEIAHGAKLILNNSNSYTGGTTIAFSTLEARAAGSLPGNVAVTGMPNTGLQLDDSKTMTSNATLNVAASSWVNLDFSGTQTISALYIGDARQAPGTYGENANNPSHVFSGAGLLNIRPNQH